MDRRAFIAGIAGGLLAAPLAAEAQQAEKVYRIGVLLPLGLTPPILARFVAGMRDRGWVENQGFGAEPRYAEGRLDRLPELAATLVRLRVDVLVTMGTPATIAAKQATSTIPIVFGLVGDAVGAGIVPKTSHARVGISPGWPCTGPRWAARGSLVKEAIPRAERVMITRPPRGNPSQTLFDATADTAAKHERPTN